MGEINLSNSAGRDAVVSTDTAAPPPQVRWLDDRGRQAFPIRILKSDIRRDYGALLAAHGEPEAVAKALIEGDPELDIETFGSFLTETSRVFIAATGELVHRVKKYEILRNPDGSERERRPRVRVRQNVAGPEPLRWSGRMVDKAEACRRFVFSARLQLTHINGLTYDFLYAMAKELEERNALMMLGAGPKSNQPLLVRNGGIPHRGFLEGRTDGDRYLLVLHLSHQELKAPAPEAETPEPEAETPEPAGRGESAVDREAADA